MSGWKNGFYVVTPNGIDPLPIYCDMTTDGWGWTALVRINPSVKNSLAWSWDVWTKSGDYYNYLNLEDYFPQKEIYSNNTIWFNGWEYLYEEKDGDLYAKRWPLRDVNISSDWPWLNKNMNNWLWWHYGLAWFSYWGDTYVYLSHNNVNSPRYDFPFYGAAIGHVSDNPWGWTNYVANEDVYIFVR